MIGFWGIRRYMKRKFTPIIGDLEALTQEQRAEYVVAACEFLNVPAELGLVGLHFMDSGDGKRNLVLYVQKGATDIIRSNMGIDVDSMTEVNGPGYVGWKVTGHDKTGRHEIAVGTVSVEGLKGISVANGVMVAQTKACRRMTLQFAGGGFLDVTEIGEATKDVMNSSQSLAQIAAQPSTKINVEAGKDITETPKVEPLDSAVGAINTDGGSTPESTKRRGRPRRTVSLDSPVSVEQPVLASLPPVEVATTQATEQKPPEPPVAPVEVMTAVSVIHPVAPIEVPSDGGTIPNADQKKAYRDKLSTYINQTLPAAGFLQSQKLGSRNDKMKLFIKEMFPKANTKVLSVQQWDSLFEFLDGRVKGEGAEALVKYIDAQIHEEVLVA
jgi:hypothetical protein